MVVQALREALKQGFKLWIKATDRARTSVPSAREADAPDRPTSTMAQSTASQSVSPSASPSTNDIKQAAPPVPKAPAATRARRQPAKTSAPGTRSSRPASAATTRPRRNASTTDASTTAGRQTPRAPRPPRTPGNHGRQRHHGRQPARPSCEEASPLQDEACGQIASTCRGAGRVGSINPAARSSHFGRDRRHTIRSACHAHAPRAADRSC